MGNLPISDTLLRPSQLTQAKETYPLDLALCEDCGLLQTLQTISPAHIYDDSFREFSSTEESVDYHASQHVAKLVESRRLDRNSLVIEIGSNDGYMLKHFESYRVPVLGIDPAPLQSQAARRDAIATLATFFNRETARCLMEQGCQADVVIANNVLSRVADLNGFLAGMRMILKEDGIVVIESPYVRSLVEDGLLDQVHHGHLSHWGVTSMDHFAHGEGLFLNHVEFFALRGGIARYTLSKHENRSDEVEAHLKSEADCGVMNGEYYTEFASRSFATKEQLTTLLDDIKADGASVAGFGASAQGATMLNQIGVDDKIVNYVVDRNPYKQGLFIPGVELPVFPPSRLVDERPDYVLLLDWSQGEEVIAEQAEYRRMGGKFIMPFPTPRVV